MLGSYLAQGVCILLATVMAWPSPTAAQGGGQDEFERGFYLQTHERDAAGAAAAFARVAEDAAAPEGVRREARMRLAQCREDLATADLARLMPPEVIAYAEISNPGEHIERLAKLMGLVREGAEAPEGGKPKATPLGGGAFFPDDFTISPALLAALRTVRGAAAAITGLDEKGEPDGLLVVHPGDADLLRGVIETAVQVGEPADPIGGFRAYRLQGQAWAVVTARLLLVARTREMLAAAVERLRDERAASLARSETLGGFQKQREGALAFVLVDGPRLAGQINRHLRGRDGQIARAVLDLAHLKAVSAAVRTTDSGLAVHAQLDLIEGHRNLVYGLIRTAPCARRTLEHVPDGAAAVVMLGLNPAGEGGEAAAGAGVAAAGQFLSAMDVGRELFGNLEEVSLFVLPAAGAAGGAEGAIPQVGLVLAAKDAGRSQALWTQLLSLPAMFAPGGATSSDVEIEGAAGTQYQFKEGPPIVVVRSGQRGVIVGTPGAAAAALRAGRGDGSVLGDAGFKPLLERLTPTSSKAVLVHAGRLAETVAAVAHGHEAQHLRLIAPLLRELRICVVTDEAPTRFAVRGEVSGLPNVPEIVRTLAQMKRAQAPAHPATATRPAKPEHAQARGRS